MRVIESFFISRRGTEHDSEDRIAYTNHFACVVDGASSQCQTEWSGTSSGKVAALRVCETVETLASDVDSRKAVDALTKALAEVYRNHELVDRLQENPIERAAASVALYSAYRRQIWLVGDCQALVVFAQGTTQAIQNPRLVDEISSAARAMFVESELAVGKSISELRKADTGRKYVAELIQRQFVFQNTARNSEYAYSVIDGFPVSDNGVRIIEVPRTARSVVLASDGYPGLRPTLGETEAYRRQVLEADPLLIRVHKAIQSWRPGNDSYDDRAYLSVLVGEEQ